VTILCATMTGTVAYVVGSRETGSVRRLPPPPPSREASADPRPECQTRPTIAYGFQMGASLACLRVPRRLLPEGANEAAAWSLGEQFFLVVWGTGSSSGLAVWRRIRGSWVRLLDRRRSIDVRYGISLDDVTGDGRLDVLANEWDGGSGGCGTRVLFRIDRERVKLLFRRYTCELDAELRDGLLWFREPIGDCPHARGAAHCYAGIRLTIRGWTEDRIAVNRTIIRCELRGFDPRRNCRRA
jgi:hypothetical protein